MEVINDLRQLESNPPAWLKVAIGPPPGEHRVRSLSWRRAAGAFRGSVTASVTSATPGCSERPSTSECDRASGRLAGRAVLVGPRSGRIYVVARRVRPGKTRFGGPPSDAVLLVFGGRYLRRPPASYLIRASGRHDWEAFAAAVSPDEKLLAISYHGDDTTGVDLVDIKRSPRATCPRAMSADRSCIAAVHGDVEFADRGLVATSGSEQLLVIGRDGTLERHDTQLVDSHVTTVRIDPAGDVVYSVADCGYVGGLSRVDLGSGTVRLLATPRKSPVCGSEMALLADGETLVAAGASGQPRVAAPNSSGSI
jgi:hypothetical protein